MSVPMPHTTIRCLRFSLSRWSLCPGYKTLANLLPLLKREKSHLSDSQITHEQNYEHLDHYQSSAKCGAATHRHHQRHGAKAGNNEVNRKNNLFAPRRGPGHQVVEVVSIRLEHSRKAPQERTLGLLEKPNGHDKQRINHRQP